MARLTELLAQLISARGGDYEAKVQDDYDRLQADLEFAKPSYGTLALLTGEFSSGKTTFLKRFYSNILPTNVRAQVRYAHVRFDKVTDLLSEKRVYEAIASVFEEVVFDEPGSSKEQFFDLYRREWERHKRLFGDAKEEKVAFIKQQREDQRDHPLEYAIRLMKLSVTRHRKLPALVLDGFDQLRPKLQKTILDAAVTIFQKTFCVVTVVMDDATAWRLNRSGDDHLLSRYVTLRIWLPRPKVGEVLQSRFDYLKDIFVTRHGASRSKATTGIGRGMKWTLNPDRVAAFIRDGLLFEDPEVKDWIAMLANYDLRQVLRLCRELILSPALKKEAVFVGFATGEFNTVGHPKILRALIKPGHKNFREDPQRPVHNIYVHSVREQHSPLAPFLLLAILETCLAQDKMSNEEIRGFVSVSSIIRTAEEVYRILAAITRSVIEFLWQNELAQAYDPSQPVKASSDIRIKITPRGELHLKWASEKWDYMREMAETVPICDREVFAKMKEHSEAFHVPDQPEEAWRAASKAFARAFISYVTGTVRPSIQAAQPEWIWIDTLRTKWLPVDASPWPDDSY